jgi:hypothetical protein
MVNDLQQSIAGPACAVGHNSRRDTATLPAPALVPVPVLSKVPGQSTKGLQITEFGCRVNSPINLHRIAGHEIDADFDSPETPINFPDSPSPARCGE